MPSPHNFLKSVPDLPVAVTPEFPAHVLATKPEVLDPWYDTLIRGQVRYLDIIRSWDNGARLDLYGSEFPSNLGVRQPEHERTRAVYVWLGEKGPFVTLKFERADNGTGRLMVADLSASRRARRVISRVVSDSMARVMHASVGATIQHPDIGGNTPLVIRRIWATHQTLWSQADVNSSVSQKLRTDPQARPLINRIDNDFAALTLDAPFELG